MSLVIRTFSHRFTCLLSLVFLLCSSPVINAATPLVVSTIKPLHSLLSNIMQGVAEPQLLIADNQSIHDYQLRPSQRRLLSRATLVFFASEHVESFIPALQASLSDTRFVNLSLVPALKLLDARKLGQQHLHADADRDGHIWLSPGNAKIIAAAMSTQLSQIDPQHEPIYQQNLKQLTQRLSVLQQQISQQLKDYQHKPYLIFHDALQYFEDEFNLRNGSFVTSSAEHKMGIKYISALRQKIIQKNIHCIYYEPPHIPKLIYRLTAQQDITLLPLDPLALRYEAGTELYFSSIKHIAKQFESCLSRE